MKITIECVGKALGVLVNSGAVFPSFHQRWGDLSGVPRNVGRVSAANGVYVCWNGVISSAAISWICKGDGQPRPRSGTRPISHNVYSIPAYEERGQGGLKPLMRSRVHRQHHQRDDRGRRA